MNLDLATPDGRFTVTEVADAATLIRMCGRWGDETGMGHDQDFPRVYKPVKAVYFETTMKGQKRPGHLWAYRHGPTQPKPDRV